MALDNVGIGQSGDVGRFNVAQTANTQHLGPHQPKVNGRINEGDRKHDAGDALPEHRDYRDGEHEYRKCLQDISGAHDGAAYETRCRPACPGDSHERPERQWKQKFQYQAKQSLGRRAGRNNAAQHVHAGDISAKPVGEAGGQQVGRRIGGDRRVGAIRGAASANIVTTATMT